MVKKKREARLKLGAEHGDLRRVESHLFATLTVPTGEIHEDFKTLKEEIRQEAQEVEKLSHVGQRSLFTALSKLLGKKKELQDLEHTVRSQGKGGGGRLGERRFLVPLQLLGVGGKDRGSDTGRR